MSCLIPRQSISSLKCVVGLDACDDDARAQSHESSVRQRLIKQGIISIRMKVAISCRVRGDWFQVPCKDGECNSLHRDGEDLRSRISYPCRSPIHKIRIGTKFPPGNDGIWTDLQFLLPENRSSPKKLSVLLLWSPMGPVLGQSYQKMQDLWITINEMH